MTINSLQVNNSQPWSGLGTATVNIPTTGIYTLNVQSSIPCQSAGSSASSSSTVGQSGLTITITNTTTSTTLLTLGGSATNPTPTQSSLSGAVSFQATAADVITVAFTSANAVDAVPNAVKAVITLYQGK